jgi:hypothetical protein
MTAAPMASDGRYIYTLVQYRSDGVTSERKATYCEIYEFQENENIIKFVKEVKLTDENNQPWIGKYKRESENENYLNHGMLACNGLFLVWHSKRNVHIFELASGKRVKRFDVHGSTWLTCYDSVSSNFYSGDAGPYSYWDVWQI